MVGRLGDLWEWTVLNHQQKPLFFTEKCFVAPPSQKSALKKLVGDFS